MPVSTVRNDVSEKAIFFRFRQKLTSNRYFAFVISGECRTRLVFAIVLEVEVLGMGGDVVLVSYA